MGGERGGAKEGGREGALEIPPEDLEGFEGLLIGVATGNAVVAKATDKPVLDGRGEGGGIGEARGIDEGMWPLSRPIPHLLLMVMLLLI